MSENSGSSAVEDGLGAGIVEMGVPKFDVAGLRCKHGNLDPDHVPDLKIVHSAPVDKLVAMYGVCGTRFQGPSVCCNQCIDDRYTFLVEFERILCVRLGLREGCCSLKFCRYWCT